MGNVITHVPTKGGEKMKQNFINSLVDEVTLILQPTNNLELTDISQSAEFSISEWHYIAERLIKEFSNKSGLVNIHGPLVPLINQLPTGYTHGYSHSNLSHYLTYAYHPHHPNIGVIIKFSALAFATTQILMRTNRPEYNISYLLEKAQSKYYSIRLSRIDFAIDYFNYPEINSTSISKDILDNKIKVINSNNHPYKKVSGILQGNSIPTLYIGTKSKSTKSYLRLYDKKLEQESKYGYYYNTAQQSASWIRLEVTFRSTYAHQIGKQLSHKILSDNELHHYIIARILERYRFIDCSTQQPISITKILLEQDVQSVNSFTLPPSRNNDLAKKGIYYVKQSGLSNYLYIIRYLWGDEALEQILKDFTKYLKYTYIPNRDTRRWLHHNLELCKLPFEEFNPIKKSLESTISPKTAYSLRT